LSVEALQLFTLQTFILLSTPDRASAPRRS
jgi:hypothetical protein